MTTCTLDADVIRVQRIESSKSKSARWVNLKWSVVCWYSLASKSTIVSLVLETALESTESVIILSVSGLHVLSILKVYNWFHFWQALGREPQFLHYKAHVYDIPRTLSNNTRQSCIRVTWKDWIFSLWVRGPRSHFPLINHFLPHAGAYIVDCCDICSSCNFHEHVVFSLQASHLHVLAKHLRILYTYPGRQVVLVCFPLLTCCYI